MASFKSGIRELVSPKIDVIAVSIGSLFVSATAVSQLHEWALLALLFVSGALGSAKVDDLSKRDGYIISWTKNSLLVVFISAFICAATTDFGGDYWHNYVAALCFGVWGYGAGVVVGFLQYFRTSSKKSSLDSKVQREVAV